MCGGIRIYVWPGEFHYWHGAATDTMCYCVSADFDKIKAGWKNTQVVQALKPVPGNGQVHGDLLDGLHVCWQV